MTAPLLKTKAEQKLEYLSSLKRPLSDAESRDLGRSMHAVYERERRQRLMNRHRKEELTLLDKLRKEAAQPERYCT